MHALRQKRKSLLHSIKTDFIKHRYIYLMAVPVLAWYIIFCYMPMYGAQIAFRKFNPSLGILDSPWVGLQHFRSFFGGRYFFRTFRNTLLISIYSILYGFPAPIILALLLNEVRNKYFKRIVQNITYLPHFISLIVICGIVREFVASAGMVNDIIALLGGERQSLLLNSGLFRTIYVASGIWQNIGWNSIIYLSALAGIDPTYYEAAIIDGAGRFRRMLHVTLPGIAPTVIILFILRLGAIMNVGFEKIILLYNDNILETADVISSFVYRKGLLEANYSYSAAVGLFNSAINLFFVVTANTITRRFSETSLW